MNTATPVSLDNQADYIRGLVREGKRELAQFESAKLVAQYPREVMALCLMSYTFFAMGDLRNSLRYAKLAQAQITPDSSWENLVSASNALLMIGETQEATELLYQVRLDQITDVNNLCYIAKLFGNIEQTETAAKIFDRVASEELGYHSRQLFGVALLSLGKFDQARAEFEKAIALNPKDGVSFNQLSMLKISEHREQRIAAMESALADPAVDAINRAYLHFSLFNELDALGRLDEAWAQLQLANEVRRGEVFNDIGHDAQACDKLIEAYKNIPARPVDPEPEAPTPIFIVGLPRTGTTLMEKILSSFDEVKVCGELRTFRRELELATNCNFVNAFGHGLCKGIAELDYRQIGHEYLRKNRWRLDGHTYLVDKAPSNFIYCGYIVAALPHARIIHIERNPMDACFSNYKQFFSRTNFTYSYNLAELADHYELYAKMMQFWNEQIPDSILNIKYETLVSDPDAQVEKIREFCGLKPHERGWNENKYVTSTLSASQIRAPIHNKNVNSWQRYLKQLEPLQAELREYVDRYARELAQG